MVLYIFFLFPSYTQIWNDWQANLLCPSMKKIMLFLRALFPYTIALKHNCLNFCKLVFTINRHSHAEHFHYSIYYYYLGYHCRHPLAHTPFFCHQSALIFLWNKTFGKSLQDSIHLLCVTKIQSLVPLDLIHCFDSKDNIILKTNF